MKHSLALAALSIALLLAPPVRAADTAASDSKTIVFVCTHGSVKSQMAAAHFNKIARDRGLPYTAVSRGILADVSIPASIRAGLNSDGLAPTDDLPRKLTATEAERAVKVVAFDPVPDDQRGIAEVNYWSDVPPATKDYATARDVIMRHLDGLVPVLAAGTRPQETLRGVVTTVDERHDRITLHLKSDATVDLKVQDGLIFNSVRDGEDVEVTVENIDGAKTIVGLSKAINNIDWQAFAEPFITTAHAQDIDWPKVDQVLGRKPAVAGDVRRYGFPRTDLTVTLDGVTIKPALVLGGWVAFRPMHGGAMIMGDLVLLESEINPVMLKLIASGLEITAVHNHLLRASPATFYMHVGGHGDPVKMATALRDALGESKTPLTMPAATTPPPAIDLDTAQLDQIMGAKGQANGGVYQFGVPRREPVTEADMQLSPAGPLGVATGINFQPTGGGKAAITGDFVLIGDEVNPVIMALRTNGIEVTAVHSHMLDEQPRLFFLHFWANDDALKLAKGLRAALDKTASTGG